ncbi:hypothetical protein FJT64_005018 [Amphibalanus amphitrite]|uniref:Uncharacterized protein n=1 Tax=Amphibalanus amphitrite TaxID=1232801 RepID=A0A6A4VN03_AMPAM|nr:hypothetical protein FJT64_005018 [Amphibalanus amphitrite]
MLIATSRDAPLVLISMLVAGDGSLMPMARFGDDSLVLVPTSEVSEIPLVPVSEANAGDGSLVPASKFFPGDGPLVSASEGLAGDDPLVSEPEDMAGDGSLVLVLLGKSDDSPLVPADINGDTLVMLLLSSVTTGDDSLVLVPASIPVPTPYQMTSRLQSVTEACELRNPVLAARLGKTGN